MRILTAAAPACMLLALVLASCGDDSSGSSTPTDLGDDSGAGDGGVDGAPADLGLDGAPGDARTDTSGDAADEDVIDVMPRRVAIDLAPYLDIPPGSSDTVTLATLDESGPFVGGPAAQGAAGDFWLSNGAIRLIVENDHRAMSPCPWGGNLIDADVVREADGDGQDLLGEICLLVNAGLTILPDTFEILQPGGEGEAGVLAVSGNLGIWDFLNLLQNATTFLDGDLDLGLDPTEVLPVRVTVYYILLPDERFVRVLSALRNDGDERVVAMVSHLLRIGGTGAFHNPLNNHGGWGYESLSESNVSTTPLPFVSFANDDSSFTYVPEIRPEMGGGLLPLGGGTVSVSGVTVSVLGVDNILPVLFFPPDSLSERDGILPLEPGETGIADVRVYVGSGPLNSTLDQVYVDQGVETGLLSGQVRLPEGELPALPGLVRVTPILAADDDEGRGMSQAFADAERNYSMRLPPGDYEVRARGDGFYGVGEVTVEADADATLHIDLQPAGWLDVTAQLPDSSPSSARVTIVCEGACPDPLDPAEANLINDRLPGGFEAIVPISVDGSALIPLRPADYRVTVSRGMEYSVWPPDASQTGGQLVTIVAGQTTEISAEIAHVIDTDGVLTADFHVHALSSSDSVVLNEQRVLDFLSEGVDVLVSTDHDFIFDFAPVIERLGVGAAITSMIGAEITTSDTGHINAFPLQVDPQHRFGGALDWGNGDAFSLAPVQIYDWVNEHPGEQVIQINHAHSGTIRQLRADVLLGTSDVDPDAARLTVPDGVEDQNLWSDELTALEVQHGHGLGNMWANFRWWLTMVGRGLRITATAVTDTHRLYGDLGGSPRSFVFVGDDDLEFFDPSGLAGAVNANRLVTSNGPFFEVELDDGEQLPATLGETLAVEPGAEVTLRVRVQTPEWITVDTLDIYTNVVDDIYSTGGEPLTHALAPTQTVGIDLVEDDLVVQATGELTHSRYETTVEVPMTFDRDAYVVVVVRSEATSSMWPVVPNPSLRPRALSNPIFVDVDGGGYDDYPLAELAESVRRDRALGIDTSRAVRPHVHAHPHALDRLPTQNGALLDEAQAEAILRALVEQMSCDGGEAP